MRVKNIQAINTYSSYICSIYTYVCLYVCSYIIYLFVPVMNAHAHDKSPKSYENGSVFDAYAQS